MGVIILGAPITFIERDGVLMWKLNSPKILGGSMSYDNTADDIPAPGGSVADQSEDIRVRIVGTKAAVESIETAGKHPGAFVPGDQVVVVGGPGHGEDITDRVLTEHHAGTYASSILTPEERELLRKGRSVCIEKSRPPIREEKPRVELVPPELIFAAARGMEKGLEKYPEGDWVNKKTMEAYASLLRHILSWGKGNEYDTDGQHHLNAVAAQIAILLVQSDGPRDNRPRRS